MEYLKNIAKSLLYIFSITIFSIFIITILNYFNIINGKILSVFMILIIISALFVGGYLIGKNSKQNGWLEGIKLSLIIIAILTLFNYLGFKRLVEVKYHVIVYEKNGMECAFQIVENLGTLIEYEHKDDFSNKTISEINEVKSRLIDDIKKYKINISDEHDIKKAFELIKKENNM